VSLPDSLSRPWVESFELRNRSNHFHASLILISSGASKSWIYQTWIYVFLMMIVKILTTLIIQMDYWNDVKNMILSPFKNPKLELIVVMLIIPFFVNVLLFWVTDNFLMRNKKHFLGHTQLRTTSQRKRRGHSILEKVKVKYASHRPIKKHDHESESDLLSSEDDPIIQIQDGSAVQSATTGRIQQRNSSIQI
jgi:STIMATE family